MLHRMPSPFFLVNLRSGRGIQNSKLSVFVPDGQFISLRGKIKSLHQSERSGILISKRSLLSIEHRKASDCISRRQLQVISGKRQGRKAGIEKISPLDFALLAS